MIWRSRKGKSGVYSTDVNELERIAADKDSPGREMVVKVLDWRQLSKLKSTYTDALQAQINPDTGRVHTSYSLSGAQTGRLSSNDPNLQNIPVRTEDGRKIRRAFIAPPGRQLVVADVPGLIEGAAEANDDLMHKYLDGAELSEQEVEPSPTKAVKSALEQRGTAKGSPVKPGGSSTLASLTASIGTSFFPLPAVLTPSVLVIAKGWAPAWTAADGPALR